ncbi:phage tail family protein [Listeria booriae]|uniref:phage tail domain-containing protein n=1 Tax=Listeria booriae TaxID=1552123 RepID=UPI0016273D2F|nr:phage tail domain-containing protein [Listeria booriae]MBC1913077.1 phage tail family protein [Listeria booriae]
MTKLHMILDGEIFDLTEMFRLRIVKFERQSPQIINNYITNSGSDGGEDAGSTFDKFNYSITCKFTTDDSIDYHLKVNELFSFIYQRKSYSIHIEREPGKMFEVHPVPIDVSRIAEGLADIVLVFEVFNGFGRSFTTTLTPLTFESDIWQFAQGLELADYEYTHNSNRFNIFNASDSQIDPRVNDLEIIIKGQSEGEINIHNRTNGDRFIYYPALRMIDTLTLNKGARINGMKCGRDTNFGVIRLEEGINEFEIFNASMLEVSFDFPFIYK